MEATEEITTTVGAPAPDVPEAAEPEAAQPSWLPKPEPGESPDAFIDRAVQARADELVRSQVQESFGLDDPLVARAITEDWSHDRFEQELGLEQARSDYAAAEAGAEEARTLVSQWADEIGTDVNPDAALALAQEIYGPIESMFGMSEENAKLALRQATEHLAAERQGHENIARYISAEQRLYAGLDTAAVYEKAMTFFPEIAKDVSDPQAAAREAVHEAAKVLAGGRPTSTRNLVLYHSGRINDSKATPMTETPPPGMNPVVWKYGRQAEALQRRSR